MSKTTAHNNKQFIFRQTLGVFFSWFRGEYQHELVSGLEHEAKEQNLNLIYFSGRCLNSPHPYDNFQNTVYDLVPREELSGLIFPSLLTHYATEAELIRFLKKYADLPIVTIECKLHDWSGLLLNNKPGFEKLLTHLLTDHGYKKPVLIQGLPGNRDAAERQTLFEQALRTAKLPAEPLRIIPGDFSYLSGRKAVSILCDERKLQPGLDFDAIVAVNDLMALGARDELQTRGIAIPDTVALTGFDDALDAARNYPLLTTVRQPIFEMGRAAIRSLLNRKASQGPAYFDTQLVIRNSCGCKVPPDISIPHRGSGSPYMQTSIPDYATYQLIYVSDALKQSLSWEDLKKELYTGLPSLGISVCYLFLNNSTADFRLVFGYNEHGRIADTLLKNYSFASLTHDLLTQGQQRCSYVVLPLVLRDEAFGFLIMDVNLDAWLVYETIRSQISSSLKSIFLIKDVHEANRELAEANDKLKLAQEQKTRFFINIAHETKTPLTLIKNYLEKYMAGHQPDNSLLIIKQNLDLLTDNMVNFLDSEKIAQGKTIYNHEQVTDISQLLTNKLTLFKASANKKELSLTAEIAAEVFLQADPYAIDRVLNNLLDNALKFTPPQGKIEVQLIRHREHACLIVRDSGIGMDKEQLPTIFEPYHQLSQPLDSNQGIGMGLYIVKCILNELAATIEVESEKQQGSRFTITFQLAPSRTTLQNSGPSVPQFNLPHTPSLFQEPVETALTPDKPVLLIVEDNLPMLAFLQSALMEKYSVFLATNIRAALGKLETIPKPDLIISDVMMQNGDGHQFLKQLMQQQNHNDIPFIFLTAKHSQEDKLLGLAEGAIDYILKPFSMEELTNKVDTIIGLRAKQRQHEAAKLKEKIVNILTATDNTKHNNEYFQFEKKCAEVKLSRREKDVLTLLLKGLLNKEIALKLSISVRAVEFHITNLYKKLNVKDRYELFALFKNHQ